MGTMQELQMLQALPLDVKIEKTKKRIQEWVNQYGIDGVYISFSGGKDSTVLLDIARSIYPDIRAMFVDVPTQYPELKQFAMTYNDVDVIKPRMNFFQVCEKFGFPLISKEVSQKVYEFKLRVKRGHKPTDSYAYKFFYPDNDAQKSMFDMTKYRFLLDAKFTTSNRCCTVMKKEPAHNYSKTTKRNPITAEMADESRLRTQHWIKYNCNGFDLKTPKSTPMAFWNEQDVLMYIKTHNLPICSVYGDVVLDDDEQLDGQTNLFEMYDEKNILKQENPKLKTTGCKRTGCVLCAYGAQCEKKGEGRFEMLRKSHPNWYRMLDVAKNNGVTYREAIEWVNEHSDINIPL